MHLIAGLIALLISTSTIQADIVPTPENVTKLVLTGSDFGGQALALTAYAGLELLVCPNTNITGLDLSPAAATNNTFVAINASDNDIEDMPSVYGYEALLQVIFQNCGLIENQVDELLFEVDASGASNVYVNVLDNAPPGDHGLLYIEGIESRGGTVDHE